MVTDETESGGGVLPRVTPCADGSLCCNNDPGCCSNGRGVFLDENGNKVNARATAATTSYPPLGTGTGRFTLTPSTSTTSTTSSTSTTETVAGTSGSGPGTTAPVEDGAVVGGGSARGDDMGMKIGLGVGIPVGVLAVAGMGFLLFKRRAASNKTVPHELGDGREGYAGGDSLGGGASVVQVGGGPPSEMYAPSSGGKYYYGGPPTAPVEISSPGVSELGTTVRHELGS